MTLDLVASLVACERLDKTDLAKRLAASYQRRLRYDPGLAKVLLRIREGDRWETATRSAEREGARGNGAAVRAAAIGLWCAVDRDDLEQRARASAVVTHAHPLAQEGAVLIARAVSEGVRGGRTSEILGGVLVSVRHDLHLGQLARVGEMLDGNSKGSVASRARRLGTSRGALESCSTALFIALAHLDDPFDALIETAVSAGGHVDAIAAMAGAVWGAANGVSALSEDLLEQLEGRYEIDALARDLHALAQPAELHARSA